MSQKTNKLSQFWQELKRRRVIHVITVYASAAFVIIQLVNELTKSLNLPARLPIIVIAVLAIGFPLAIICSWRYALTSEGIKKTKPMSDILEGEKTVIPRAWKIATYVSVIVIIGLVVFNIMDTSEEIRHGEIHSIVIPPFDNSTGDDQIENFASGMHSNLIGDIGQINGLRVISKATSDVYQGDDMSALEIASELNVDAVIEGKVTCLGDSICLQVRVISAFPEEKTLWIADYKEEKSKILNLHNQITKQIANELRIRLSADEDIEQ